MKLGATPVLAFTLADHVARLSLFFLPQDLRGHGLGRRLFEAWEESLPPDITDIELLPAEIDGTSPVGFWQHLGFVPTSQDPVITEIAGGTWHRPRSAQHS